MTPILGILDSAKSGNLAPSGYVWLATATGNPSGTSTISGIPSSYDYLELRMTLHSVNGSDLRMVVNNDTSSSYTFHQMYMTNNNGVINGSTYQGATLNPEWSPANIVSSALDANLMCSVVMQISNSSGKWKMYQARSAWTNAVGQTPMDGFYIIRSGQFQSTAQISSLVFGGNTSPYGLSSISKIDLYGIKV